MEGGALRPGRGDAARVRYTLEEIFLSVINSKNERELGESRESPQPAKGPGKIRAPVLHRKSVIYPSLVPSEEILDRPFWFTRVEKTRRRSSHVGSLLDWQFAKIADTWCFRLMWRTRTTFFKRTGSVACHFRGADTRFNTRRARGRHRGSFPRGLSVRLSSRRVESSRGRRPRRVILPSKPLLRPAFFSQEAVRKTWRR